MLLRIGSSRPSLRGSCFEKVSALAENKVEGLQKWFPEQREYLSIDRDPDYQGSPDRILLTLLGISRKNPKSVY